MNPSESDPPPGQPFAGPGPIVADPSLCDLESIQFPGAIMPHGALLVLHGAEATLVGTSANSGACFGLAPEPLLGGTLEQILAAAEADRVRGQLAALAPDSPARHLGQATSAGTGRTFELFAHRVEDRLLLEWEAAAADSAGGPAGGYLGEVAAGLARLQQARTWQEGMAIAVAELQRLTGFGTVLGVRFLPDGSMQAVAEARDPERPSYWDKRFPRSDIPEPARRQMVLTPSQYAPDLAYEAVPLIMSNGDARALDLGRAVLRSTSPMCRRFYLNIGNRARFVLSLFKEGELWGYLSCWHATPKSLPYATRLVAETLARMVALLLVEKEESEAKRSILEAKRRVDRLLAGLSDAADLTTALRTLPVRLLDALDIAGTALVLDSGTALAGETPPAEALEALCAWLDSQPDLLVTDRLPALSGLPADRLTAATGLLAARLAEPGSYLMGFRPEWPHEVLWAGNPEKPLAIDSQGTARLTARGSFETWRQDVRGMARPWQEAEQETFADLHKALLRLQHGEMLQALRLSLERSNTELEAFAYVASHDLQEPLRSIRNFSQFLDESIGATLPPRERAWLDIIRRQGARMGDLLQALLNYSLAGQQHLEMQAVNLDELLHSVLQPLSAWLAEAGAEVSIACPLPTVVGDPIRLATVFENLISNAIKYNVQAAKHIEIGYRDGAVPAFYVRDNGIGIPPEQQTAVFTIFRRLHGRDEYGGGNGAGLTIARKHVERHGGRMWLESEPGVGTSFHFTLAAE